MRGSAAKRGTVGLVAAVVALAGLFPALGAEPEEAAALAKIEVGKEAIEWSPAGEYERAVLAVSGPGVDLERDFPFGKTPHLAVESKEGRLPDGSYAWELRLTPRVSSEKREKLAAAREALDSGRDVDRRELRQSWDGPTVQSGHFSVRGGTFVSPGEKEPGRSKEQTGDVRVAGNLEAAGRKSFVVADPLDGGRQLVYAALEGPEPGTYHRGTSRTANGEAIIELPAHFASTTEPRGLTVQLTPAGGWGRLYVAEKTPRRLVIRSADGTDVDFDYFVQGVRRGYADFQVERPLSPASTNGKQEER